MPTATNAVTLLNAEHAAASVLMGVGHLRDAYPELLQAIGRTLEWDVGAAWELDPDSADSVHCVEVWSGSLTSRELARLCAIDRLSVGQGLPGRVWATGKPHWVSDIAGDPNFPRHEPAAAAGLRSALCFPVRSEQGLDAVIEFLTRERQEADAQLLDTMASLGRQIGQFLDRSRADQAIRLSEARHRATLVAALDAVVTIDRSGHVLDWNPAAEGMFGVSRDEALGRDMSTLIVPVHLRGRHRAGFARYLETGVAKVLDRRLEITAVRSDGDEFPVELAITRIPVAGPPVFTGYIRDITERRRAEAELRASRARVLEAADSERRRIERDLHDGAQQRLVGLALSLRLARSRMDDDPTAAADLLDESMNELAEATSELRELARGIHPAVLTDRGLPAALKALAARSPVPVELTAPEGNGGLPAPVEAAVYFVVAESLTNVARYAHATRAEVLIERADRCVTVEVRDDGGGGADPSGGSGLRGLFDRVATLDGVLDVSSPPGGGTVVRAELPCE